MEPDVFGLSINLLSQDGVCLRLSRPHQPCLLMEGGNGRYS